MRATPIYLAAAAVLAQSPLAAVDGEYCDVHELPRFVVERVELPLGTRADCLREGSRGSACPAVGASAAALQHGNAAAACPPRD